MGTLRDPSADGGGAGLFRVLWRQKLLVAIPIVIFLGLGIAYLVTERKLYTAAARMTVTPAGSRLSGDSSDASSFSNNNFLFTQREKVLSREILALALSQPLPDNSGKMVRDLRTFKEADLPALTEMRDGADVEVGKKDDVVSVYFESADRAEAAIIANAIVDAYMKYQTQPKHSNTADVLDAHKAEKRKSKPSWRS